MATYSGYIKISDSSANWMVDSKLIKKTKWVVLEKVHGSCFCFIYDIKTNTITCAKRKELLADDDNFFGYKNILDEIIPKINMLLNTLLKIIVIIKQKYLSMVTMWRHLST